MSKEELEDLLVVGAKIKIGSKYAKAIGGLKAGEVITLVEGYFDCENGLYCTTETAPSIWNENAKEFDSIYHLFGNNFENFMDCKILTNDQ